MSPSDRGRANATSGSRRRKRAFSILVVTTLAYLALCLVARLGYPRLLFPAPRLDRAPSLDDPEARLIELPQADGSRTVVLHHPAPPGARTVVLFHGNGQTIFHVVAHGAELVRRGLGVLLVEYRGYGTTYGPPPSETMIYEDGEAALAYLAREHVAPEQIALWGYSLGSGVAAEMARRGHGARLVLLAPFTSIIAMGRRAAPILPVELLMSHRFDTLSKAASIHEPTLVIHGDNDEVVPFVMGEEVAARIAGAQFIRVGGGHHGDLLRPAGGGHPGAAELFDRLAKHLGQ